MTDLWKLPDGRIVDDDGLVVFIKDCIDDEYIENYLDEIYPEVEVVGSSYPMSYVASKVLSELDWKFLRDDLVEFAYADREYGSVEEFGVEPVEQDDSESVRSAMSSTYNKGKDVAKRGVAKTKQTASKAKAKVQARKPATSKATTPKSSSCKSKSTKPKSTTKKGRC